MSPLVRAGPYLAGYAGAAYVLQREVPVWVALLLATLCQWLAVQAALVIEGVLDSDDG